VEMLVVLMILALISSISLLYLPNRYNDSRMGVLAGDIMQSLNQTRLLALKSHQDAFFKVNLQMGRFWLEGAGTGEYGISKLPDDVEVEMHTALDEVDTDNISAIRFFPDGSSTGGYIRIKNKNKAYKISINWLTGKVFSENDQP